MPVIGRLDSQVNDVLIEPVGDRRRRGEGDGRGAGATTDDARPAAPGETPRDGADGSDDEARDNPRGEARRGEQLPVWLL
ncbi:MAG TPA: hypothetical protein VF538_12035 [Pyrinomonadaceae bacterium]|jgi:hypothetical protein